MTDLSHVAETYQVVHESNRAIWENVAAEIAYFNFVQ